MNSSTISTYVWHKMYSAIKCAAGVLSIVANRCVKTSTMNSSTVSKYVWHKMCGGRAVDCHYKTRQTEHAPNWKNAPNCRAPNWHRVEVGRAQLDRVKQACVKKDVPKWTGIQYRVYVDNLVFELSYVFVYHCMHEFVQYLCILYYQKATIGISHSEEESTIRMEWLEKNARRQASTS